VKGNINRIGANISKLTDTKLIGKELKGIGFSNREIIDISKTLKTVNNQDNIISFLTRKVTDKIIETQTAGKIKGSSTKRYTTNELANLSDTQLAKNIYDLSDEQLKILGFTDDTTALTERVFNNRFEKLKEAGVQTNSVFQEVIGRDYRGQKY